MEFQTIQFSNRLRELCKSRGTIAQAARDLDINRQQFARYINGTSLPRLNVIEKMAHYFGVSPGQLFSDHPLGQNTLQPVARNVTINALTALFGDSNLEQITEDDLRPGYYMQHKRMFLEPKKIMSRLVHIRNDNGVYRYRCRMSAMFKKHFYQSAARYTLEGVFMKQHGVLLMINRALGFKDITMYAFRTSAQADPDYKPGFHMSGGVLSGNGPQGTPIVLHYVREDQSVYDAARQQQIVHETEVPGHIMRYL